MSMKFVSPCPPPSPRLAELIQVLTEEGCEVGQRGMKALRFGDQEVQPDQPQTNLERIQEEVGDFLGVVQLMCNEGYFDYNQILAQAEHKKEKLRVYLQTDRESFD